MFNSDAKFDGHLQSTVQNTETGAPCSCHTTFREDPYDHGPFMEFPERIGFSSLVTAVVGGDEVVWTSNSVLKRDWGFFQAWLFFGLLHQVLQESYCARDFILGHPHLDLEISTTRLPILIEKWRDKALIVQTPDEDAIQYLVTCLNIASQCLNHLEKHFDSQIRASTASIVHGLGIAIYHSSHISASRSARPFLITFDTPPSTREVERMTCLGWCPQEIANLTTQWDTIYAQYFISHLNKRAPHRDHSKCSRTHCVAYTSRPPTYATHTDDCDGCSSIVIDGRSLTTILRQGHLPLLPVPKFSTSDQFIISPVPWQKGMSYTAISHVWIDGLGNPYQNALPRCQVSRISDFVRAMQTSPSESGKDLYFWLDTLCCPCERYDEYQDGKVLALNRMRETYEEAEAVLVLDASLVIRDCHEISSLEILVRVLSSGWSLRLWALQEAALAKVLYAQFRDRIVRSTDDHSLSDVIEAVKYRAVTVKSDEPLCLATLMRLPVSLAAVPENPEDLRMQAFWDSVAESTTGIPNFVAFLPYPRLGKGGYRWAPRSFLDPDPNISLRYPINANPTHKFGSLSARGLTIRCPGATYRPSLVPENNAIQMAKDEQLPSWFHKTVYLRMAPNKWYEIHGSPDDDDSLLSLVQNDGVPQAFIWLVSLETHNNHHQATAALAVELLHHENAEMPVARIQRHVDFEYRTGLIQNVLESVHEAACALRERINAEGGDALSNRRLNRKLEMMITEAGLPVLASQTDATITPGQLNAMASDLVKLFAFGYYLLCDQSFSVDHEWCLE
ncbi:uncharacterized protein KY384_001298 [Bacidia gigantensis]|uniref:uncharacterized protein n=1 Tax=Bacidia gigantensis TaxID=2732470 RepID=UPI001D03D63C|nr:uncharacterized protein KY384_001298 [Bacidia gigantensis]KAG8533558.1 hypothetical protein KY384_001298 [Bacidia gigantensis]